MTIHDWLVHLWHWLRMFPLKRDDDHCWTSLIGEPDETCLVCSATRIDPDWTPADREWANEYRRKHPDLSDDEGDLQPDFVERLNDQKQRVAAGEKGTLLEDGVKELDGL